MRPVYFAFQCVCPIFDKTFACVFVDVAPSANVYWYFIPNSPKNLVTRKFMETWRAWFQQIVQALPPYTDPDLVDAAGTAADSITQQFSRSRSMQLCSSLQIDAMKSSFSSRPFPTNQTIPSSQLSSSSGLRQFGEGWRHLGHGSGSSDFDYLDWVFRPLNRLLSVWNSPGCHKQAIRRRTQYSSDKPAPIYTISRINTPDLLRI